MAANATAQVDVASSSLVADQPQALPCFPTLHYDMQCPSHAIRPTTTQWQTFFICDVPCVETYCLLCICQYACQQRVTFHQDAQVGACEGGVGVVDDDHLAVRVQQEQRRLGEGLVRLANVARLCNVRMDLRLPWPVAAHKSHI